MFLYVAQNKSLNQYIPFNEPCAFDKAAVVSSPEHKMIMVSYYDLIYIVSRASYVVRLTFH